MKNFVGAIIILVFGSILYFIINYDEQNLGSDYYYLPEYEAMDIGYPYGSIIYKSANKFHFKKIAIFSDVIACKSSTDYILAIQQPNDSLARLSIKHDLEMWEHFPTVTIGNEVIPTNKLGLISGKNNDFTGIADSLFHDSKFYQNMFQNKFNYFIIDKRNDKVSGPLTKREFETIKVKRNIKMQFD